MCACAQSKTRTEVQRHWEAQIKPKGNKKKIKYWKKTQERTKYCQKAKRYLYNDVYNLLLLLL